VIGTVQLAGALALLLSIALLCAIRTATAVRACAVQALLVAVVLGAPGWRHASLALVAFALSGVVIPLVLQRVLDRPGMAPSIAMRGGDIATWIAALILLVATVATFTQVRVGGASDALVFGASIALLGLLMVARRPHPLMPALGLLSSQNGLILVAGATADLPLPALLIVVVPLVPALLAANAWLRQ
jgi:hydrogenase-4 membrane subunit HyfE